MFPLRDQSIWEMYKKQVACFWTVEEVDLRKEVAQFAQKENWLVLTLKIEQKTLEEVFKELTK